MYKDIFSLQFASVTVGFGGLGGFGAQIHITLINILNFLKQ